MVGRPREHGLRTSMSIRFNPETHEALAAAAAERDLSINFLVNRAVEQFLAALIPVDEMTVTR